MSPAPRKPGRPAAGRAGARRAAPEPRVEIDPETGEEVIVEEAPPKPPFPVVGAVALGAGVLFAVLLSVFLLGQRTTHLEVENLEMGKINKVVLKINGEVVQVGDLREHEVADASVKRIPGRDIVVEYELPNRGKFERKVTSPVDFGENSESVKIRLSAQGIEEIVHGEKFCLMPAGTCSAYQ